MKQVFLVRHAKSSWDHPGLRDVERPLNERGQQDAPFMAKLVKGKGIKPDAILTSPAVRALTTANYFKLELGVDGEDFFIRDEIYESIPQTILHLINTLPETYQTVMIFGHNPTFTSVANLFTKDFIGNVPTCGIVGIASTALRWPDFSAQNAVVSDYFFPKQYS
ncbi:MAG: histidine phosphatase family protein [Saprospiraceae bacterium]